MSKKSTSDIVEEMMKNAGLNHRQKNVIRSRVKNSETLPLNPPSKDYIPSVYGFEENKLFGEKSYYSRKRTKKQMLINNPNIYKPVKAPKEVKSVNREVEKQKLQKIFQFGGKQNIPIVSVPKKRKNKKSKKNKKYVVETPSEKKFHSVKKEIDERIKFLDDMKKLGEGKKYEDMIKSQIAVKVREMEELNKIIGKEDYTRILQSSSALKKENVN